MGSDGILVAEISGGGILCTLDVAPSPCHMTALPLWEEKPQTQISVNHQARNALS